LYILCCGISKKIFESLKFSFIRDYKKLFPNRPQEYFGIPFSPSNRPYAYLYWGDDNLDNKVGEFIVKNYKDKVNDYEWTLNKIRYDRDINVASGTYFGNNYKIAELIWMSYDNPLVIEKLKNNDNIYFKKSDSPLHKLSRTYNSYVKNKIFDIIDKDSNVMDLASGKGQDMFRYAKRSVNNIMFVEYDKTALMELIERKFVLSKQNLKMHINVQQMDLNNAYKTNIKQITNSKIDIKYNYIMCNLALHYLIKNKNSIQNIAKFISNYLKKGTFIFTAFDGKEVLNLLSKHKGHWKSKVSGKYELKSVGSYDKLEDYGQEVDVLLPFSDGGFYREYLLNIEYLEKVFSKEKLIINNVESYSKYFDSGDIQDVVEQFDSDDRTYLSLYHIYEFKKK